MIAAAYGPVSDIEIVFTLSAFVGLLYSLLNVREARLDRKVLLDAKVGNGRLTLARYQLQAEMLRSVTQAIFLSIGLAAMSLPEPPNRLDLPTSQIIVQVFVTYGLIIASVLLSFKSYLGYRVRKILNSRR